MRGTRWEGAAEAMGAASSFFFALVLLDGHSPKNRRRSAFQMTRIGASLGTSRSGWRDSLSAKTLRPLAMGGLFLSPPGNTADNSRSAALARPSGYCWATIELSGPRPSTEGANWLTLRGRFLLAAFFFGSHRHQNGLKNALLPPPRIGDGVEPPPLLNAAKAITKAYRLKCGCVRLFPRRDQAIYAAFVLRRSCQSRRTSCQLLYHNISVGPTYLGQTKRTNPRSHRRLLPSQREQSSLREQLRKRG